MRIASETAVAARCPRTMGHDSVLRSASVASRSVKSTAMKIAVGTICAKATMKKTPAENHQGKASRGQSVGESGERAEVEVFTTDVGFQSE